MQSSHGPDFGVWKEAQPSKRTLLAVVLLECAKPGLWVERRIWALLETAQCCPERKPQALISYLQLPLRNWLQLSN
uniref:Uncharacterized protein n=1 Tax=Anguilla anguilla TaxID=7936 RepID=A0A0E9T523_ANGAN